MGLKETIQQAVKSGLGALDNAYPTITYRAVGTPSYNATTGAPGTSPTAISVRAFFYAYTKEEIDGEVIKPQDQKVLIGATQLTVTPTLNDQIVDTDGKVWNVQNAKKDPMGATWIVQVRKP